MKISRLAHQIANLCLDTDGESTWINEERVRLLISEYARSIYADCANTARQWRSSIYPVGDDVDYETAMSIANDIPRNIARSIIQKAREF